MKSWGDLAKALIKAGKIPTEDCIITRAALAKFLTSDRALYDRICQQAEDRFPVELFDKEWFVTGYSTEQSPDGSVLFTFDLVELVKAPR